MIFLCAFKETIQRNGRSHWLSCWNGQDSERNKGSTQRIFRMELQSHKAGSPVNCAGNSCILVYDKILISINWYMKHGKKGGKIPWGSHDSCLGVGKGSNYGVNSIYYYLKKKKKKKSKSNKLPWVKIIPLTEQILHQNLIIHSFTKWFYLLYFSFIFIQYLYFNL